MIRKTMFAFATVAAIAVPADLIAHALPCVGPVFSDKP